MRPPFALVADDCALTRQVHADMLRGLGYSVALAASGNDAVREAQRAIGSHGRPYDLTLLDFDMPDGDGPTTARMIRAAQSGLWMPPMLCVTSHAPQQVEAVCLAAGFDAVIAKPLQAVAVLPWARGARRG